MEDRGSGICSGKISSYFIFGKGRGPMEQCVPKDSEYVCVICGSVL